MSYIHTSESVSVGHPDKIADQISDLILDLYLQKDPYARVAAETVLKNNLIFLTGEISSSGFISDTELTQSIRDLIHQIGYCDEKMGFSADSASIIHFFSQQSPDIAFGVDERADKKLAAGDQGVMIGYACDDTPEMMPASFVFAKKCLARLRECMKEHPFLGPDAKCQVSVVYNQQGDVQRILQVTLSAMHTHDIDMKDLRYFLEHDVIRKVLPDFLLKNTEMFLNPSGRFVIGGPASDAGLTGRKLMVDSYGPSVPHGGGAFSGKDATKVDRTGAYLARWIAKHLVGLGLAKRAIVEVAFAIGYPSPVALEVFLDGCRMGHDRLVNAIRQVFPMNVGDMIEELGLRTPSRQGFSYLETAQNGHFGFEHYPWERLNKLEALKKALDISK